MHMIVDTANGLGHDVMIAIDGGHVVPKPRLNFLRDALNAVLGAEHQMDVVLGIGVGQEAPPRNFWNKGQ